MHGFRCTFARQQSRNPFEPSLQERANELVALVRNLAMGPFYADELKSGSLRSHLPALFLLLVSRRPIGRVPLGEAIARVGSDVSRAAAPCHP